MIQRLLEAYGAQRLMWATDCPYQLTGSFAGGPEGEAEGGGAAPAAHSYAASLALIQDEKLLPFLSAEDREWILRRTAERVFFFA